MISTQESAPLVTFHRKHGCNITLSANKRQARRIRSFSHGICFTNRPIFCMEKIFIRIGETNESDWEGTLGIGVSMVNPNDLDQEQLPPRTTLVSNNSAGFWGKDLPKDDCQEGNAICVYLTKNGSLIREVSGGASEVLLNDLNTKDNIWLLLDIYGSVKTLEIISDPDLMKVYRRSLEDGTYETCRARLMFVGHYKVGKTSVVRALLGLPFVGEHLSTEGIETRTAHAQKSIDIIDATDWKQAEESTVQITENEFQNEVLATLKSGITFGTVPRTPDADKGGRSKWKPTFSRSQSEPGLATNAFPVDERDLFHLGNIQLKSEMQSGQTDSTFSRRFSMYDFAGQVEFYATHHLFVDRKAVFILVLDITQSLDSVIESKLSGRFKSRPASLPRTVKDFARYWLKTIHAQTYRSQVLGGAEPVVYPKVIVVFTHKDEIVANDKGEYVEEYWRNFLKCIDGEVYASNVYTKQRFILDNKNGDHEEVNRLKETIQEIAQDQCQWGVRKPVRWLKLESDIHIKAMQQNKDYIRKDLVEKLSARYSMPGEELDDFLRYHHEIGDLLYFPHGSQILREYVITNPQWLIDIFNAIISAPSDNQDKQIQKSLKLLDSNGIVDQTLLIELWGRQNIRFLIDLMVEFDLMIPLKDRSFESMVEDYTERDLSTVTYAVPCMMPVSDLDQFKVASSPHPPLLFSSVDRFIPLGTFQRVVAACGKIKSWKLHGKMFYNAAEFILTDDGSVLVSLVLLARSIMLQATFLSKETRKQNYKLFPQIANTVWTCLSEVVGPTEFQVLVCPCDCFTAGEECLINVHELCSQEKISRPSRRSLVKILSLSSPKPKVANFPNAIDDYHDAVCADTKHKRNHLSPQQYGIWFCGSDFKPKYTVKPLEMNQNSSDEIFLEYSQRIVSEDILFSVGIKLGLAYADVKAVRTDNPSDIKLAGLAMLQEWQRKSGVTETSQILAALKTGFESEESRMPMPSTNGIESMLWTCSRIIVTQDLLFGVGVTIGLPYREIQATLTNNQADIQLAGFRMLVKGQIMNKWGEKKLRDELIKAFQQQGIWDIFG